MIRGRSVPRAMAPHRATPTMHAMVPSSCFVPGLMAKFGLITPMVSWCCCGSKKVHKYLSLVQGGMENFVAGNRELRWSYARGYAKIVT